VIEVTKKKVPVALLFLLLVACEKKVSPTSTSSAPASASPKNAAVDASSASSPSLVTSRGALTDVFTKHPEIHTLDDLPRFFPSSLKKSFVLKHGRDRKGERGHLVETKISQSADPLAPRAILFDEKSGFLVSYNGGLTEQKNGHRLDVHWFDDARKTFVMEAIEFPQSPQQQPDGGEPLNLKPSTECATCHGPRGRPIFSMYPDWPGFYGSDNDEVTNTKVAVQAAELTDYRRFRTEVAPKHPRYESLFRQGDDHDGDRAVESFPFRPDVSEDIHAISRAFAFRPGLRLGILLNRLQARALVEYVTHHARYEKHGAVFLSHLLQCRSPIPPNKSELEPVLGEPIKLVGDFLHYRQLWKLFDLEVRDVDIRYGYGHDGYRSDDASKNPMAVGYVGTYWNSYFDGSATIDELVAYGLYEDQQKRHPSLEKLVTPNGLTKKYSHLKERFARDEAFFRNMDDKGQWISIPYPKAVHDVHHREGFPSEHKKQHEALCAALAPVTQ
jgi:hypothetical protein